jgi:hypothetical protein
MATCNREDLERKWAAERNDLRHECQAELKQKLPIIAWAQSIVLKEDRKALLALHDETLMQLMQKLDAIAHSGKQLSHIFHNSLASTRFGGVLFNGKNPRGKDLTTEADDNVDSAYRSGREPAVSRAQSPGQNTQTAGHCTDLTARYLPPSFHTTIATTDDPAQIGVGGGESLMSADRPRAQPCEEDTSNGHSWGIQLAELVQERGDLDRQLSEERTVLAKRCAYLRECRVAADKEKVFAQNELASAMLLLAAAEKERAVAADCRATASEEMKKVTPLQKRSQTPKSCCAGIGLDTLGASEKNYGHDSSTTCAQSLQLRLGISSTFSQPLSTCPVNATPTPPPSLCELMPNRYTEHSFSTPAAVTTESGIYSMPEPECHLEPAVDLNPNGGQYSVVTSNFGVKVEMATVSGNLENPIGPYIRPPMPLDDMLKCIRCLFGKDKSLKTGNRARAFLGVPWSEIVSFDPDVLLRRGVLGIKEGSTGMASRLRMMTIIESALSNQNDGVSPATWVVSFIVVYLHLMPIDNSS